jgi:MFS-type transporter involved in bile tolerance (Atg22 family)
MIFCAPQSPKLSAKFGTNKVVAGGLLCIAASMFLYTIARTDTSYWALLLVMVVMAAGMANVVPSMTGSIMSAVPMGRAGVGSAMNDTTRELGGALGVAVLGSLVASRYDSRLGSVLDVLPASVRSRAEESLAGALQAAHTAGVSATDSARVADVAREAYVSGMHLAAVIAGCVTLIASGIVYRKLPSGNPHAHGAASIGRPGDAAGADAEAETSST